MSASAAPADFRPEQCREKQAQPHGAAVTQGHERGMGPGPFLKSPGSLLTSATPSLQAFVLIFTQDSQPGGLGALEKPQPSL